jgi:hypothetical protein
LEPEPKYFRYKIMKCLFKKVGGTIRHYPEQKNLEFEEYVEVFKLEKKNRKNNNEPQPN